MDHMKASAESTAPKGTDTVIVRAAIHPAIGIARIGDAKTEYFIGPEVTDAPPENAPPPSFYRDKTGAIKRQAARFRIYGYNAAGDVVSELTSDNADIHWTVHVANRKAQWYQFQYALDIPEAINAPDNAFPLRNPKVMDRSTLAIDPGPAVFQAAVCLARPMLSTRAPSRRQLPSRLSCRWVNSRQMRKGG